MQKWRNALVMAAVLVAGCAAGSLPQPGSTGPAGPAGPDGGLPAGFYPAAIAFWDGERGLMAGQGGCPDRCGPWLIAATADGGRHWQVVYTGDGRIGGLAAAGSRDAWASVWACTDAGPDCQVTLLRTGNAGQTWRPVSTGVTGPSFADANTGWALPAAGRDRDPDQAPPILATGDGGLIWRPIPSPCQERRFGTRAVSLVSATAGWVACSGQAGAGQQLKALYRTADGGQTWTPAGELGGGGYLAGIFFRPDGHGWAWRSRGGLSATADGGQTWNWVEAVQAEVREARAVWFLSGQAGFLLLQDDGERHFKLLWTGDGGASFSTRGSWPRDPGARP